MEFCEKTNRYYHYGEGIAYGVTAAVILSSLKQDIALNQAKHAHYINCRYWTRFSAVEKHDREFPEFSVSTISRALRKLEKAGVIISANHNHSKHDRRKWYAMFNFCHKLNS